MKINDFSDSERKKIIGQYFSGEKVSKLLSAFTIKESDKNCIDPMCGSGDMLVEALNLKSLHLIGVDIDEKVKEIVLDRLKNNLSNEHSIIVGNAFSVEVFKNLPYRTYDVVITNPPYVRYQTLYNYKEISELPDSISIRSNLLKIVELNETLTLKEKKIFNDIITSYSGLSDLSVPSWILCMLLTKKEGSIGMVVPESWLKTDYSYPIQYLLYKFFDLQYIIEDVDRKWFTEVSVKTNLIVAKRKSITEEITNIKHDKKYKHISLKSEHGNSESLVGELIKGNCNKETIFKNYVDTRTRKDINEIVEYKDINHIINNLIFNIKSKKWFYVNENLGKNSSNIGGVPYELKKYLKNPEEVLESLSYYNVEVGQGLRTGANKFFYVDEIQADNDTCYVKTDKLFNKILKVDNKILYPVIRKQKELNNLYSVKKQQMTGRVLVLNEYNTNYIDTNLYEYLCRVEKTNIGSLDNPKYIPNLSAVRTNTKLNYGTHKMRYWYMLPEFKKRHFPLVFVARINSNRLKFILNDSNPLLVDANFSTIWLNAKSTLNRYSLLAILNSTWIILNCEYLGNVMGGGALKLEATHLKKIQLPRLNSNELVLLEEYGQRLAEGDKEVLDNIDKVINNALNIENSKSLSELLKEKLYIRTKKYN